MQACAASRLGAVGARAFVRERQPAIVQVNRVSCPAGRARRAGHRAVRARWAAALRRERRPSAAEPFPPPAVGEADDHHTGRPRPRRVPRGRGRRAAAGRHAERPLHGDRRMCEQPARVASVRLSRRRGGARAVAPRSQAPELDRRPVVLRAGERHNDRPRGRRTPPTTTPTSQGATGRGERADAASSSRPSGASTSSRSTSCSASRAMSAPGRPR